MSPNDKKTLVVDEGREGYGAVNDAVDEESSSEQTYTVQESLDHSGCGVGNFIAIGSGFGANMAEGIEGIAIAIILPKLVCEWNLVKFLIIAIPISIICSQIIGGLIAAKLIDSWGRLKMLIVGQIFVALTSLLSAFSQNVWQFIIIRIFMGIFMEFTTCTAPAYAIEFSPKSARAMFQCGQSLSFDIGAFGVTLLCYFLLESAGWRIILILASLPIFVSAFLLLFQYETPFYNVGQGKLEEAELALDMIYKYNKTEKLHGKLAKHEFIEDPATFKLTDYFDSSEKLKQVFYFFIIMFALMYFGWGMGYASPRLLNEGYCHDSGIKEKVSSNSCHTYSQTALFSLTITMLVKSFGNIAFFIASDIYGRLNMLRFGSLVMNVVCASMLICGGKIKLVIEISIFNFVFSGLFVVTVIYLNENYPTHIRGAMNSLSYSFGRLSAIIGIMLALLLTIEQMWVFILVTLVLSCCLAICSFLLNTETRDITII